MQFIGLTFDHSIKKLEDIGRFWSSKIYRNKENIYDYSAASYATFIHHNPDRKLTLMVDDVSLMLEKLSKYDIDLTNVIMKDWSKEIEEFKKDKFAFKPLVELIRPFKDSGEYTTKLDNDLVCHGKVQDDFGDPNAVAVWKLEGLVKDGDIRWGEKLACERIFNETNFIRYNVGLIGMPTEFLKHYEEYAENTEKLVNVDITSVSDLGVKMYHCCDQTSYNWLMHKYGFKVNEMYGLFDHHFDDKNRCISAARGLLKNVT